MKILSKLKKWFWFMTVYKPEPTPPAPPTPPRPKSMYLESKIERLVKELERVNSKYIDSKIWAVIRDIDEPSAQIELEEAFESNVIKKGWLYEWEDTPVPFVVPFDYVGKVIQLSEMNIFEDDDDDDDEEDREITLNPEFMKLIYFTQKTF